MANVNARYVQQLKNLIVAVGGDNLTCQTAPDRDHITIFYTQCFDFVGSNRLNVEFKEQIELRKEVFQPWFKLEPISAEMKRVLQEMFTDPSDTAFKTKEALWNKYKNLKSFCRGEAGASYKSKTKKLKSGTYDDLDALKEIQKVSVIKSINENQKKYVSDFICKAKKEAKGHSQTLSPSDMVELEKEGYAKCFILFMFASF